MTQQRTHQPHGSGPGTPGWTPIEILGAAALILGVAVGATVWLGAGLAAVLAGRRWSASLGDAITAMTRLPRSASDPKLAWSPALQPLLPGPWLYWCSTTLVVVGLASIAWFGVTRIGSRSTKRRRLGVDVGARFATRRELRPLLIREPVSGRFVLGRSGRRLVATENRHSDAVPSSGRRASTGDLTSVAIVGPSRSGKTARCAIPGVLDWDGPAILLSVKRDLLDATIERRRTLGDVRVFDPAGLIAATPTSTSGVQVLDKEIGRWTPLLAARTEAGAKKAAHAMASFTASSRSTTGDDFWTTSSKLLLTGMVGTAALMERPSMAAMARWVFGQKQFGNDAEEFAILAGIATANAAGSEMHQAAAAARLHLESVWAKEPRLVSSIYATAQTTVEVYLDPNVRAVTEPPRRRFQSPNWIDLDWLMSERNGRRGNTLYVVVPLDDFARLAPVIGGLLSDLKTQAYEWDARGKPLPSTLLMLIDEAGNMPLPWLPQVASTCAGIGIQLVTIWQSLAQIDEAYGRLADSVLTNHPTKLFFPGASDRATLDYQSRIAGDQAVERRSWSADTMSGRRSISGSEQREPLVPYHVPRLAPIGQAFLVHGNLPPAVLHGRRWWREPRLRALARGESWPGATQRMKNRACGIGTRWSESVRRRRSRTR